VSEATATKEKTDAAPGPVTCILDLGEQSRKRVRKLKKGRGRLMDKVEAAIGDLVDQEVLDGPPQAVVIVLVREELSLTSFMDDDDDD
jgi:hypothetical protein